MWRNERDRRDDPETRERETQRLARDEYDRPRYGSPQNVHGERPREWTSNDGQAQRGENRDAPRVLDREERHPPGPHDHPQPRGFDQGQPPARGRLHLDEIRVHEIMTRRVTSVHPATSVERAVRVMEECDCGALPVVGDNAILVGMVTDRDIAIRVIGRGRDPRTALVADCMTERVFACYANESIADCMRQMARHQVRRMPIVDDRGRLVGIIAQGDLARHAARHPAREERRALTEVVGAVSEPTQRPYR
jgi:CBS domain-containing protein